jgi:hypothetical protein
MKAIHGTFLHGSKCRNAHSAEKLKPPGAKQFFPTGVAMMDRLRVADFTPTSLLSRSVVSVADTVSARALFWCGNLA